MFLQNSKKLIFNENGLRSEAKRSKKRQKEVKKRGHFIEKHYFSLFTSYMY
jgi:hypothetical protein